MTVKNELDRINLPSVRCSKRRTERLLSNSNTPGLNTLNRFPKRSHLDPSTTTTWWTIDSVAKRSNPLIPLEPMPAPCTTNWSRWRFSHASLSDQDRRKLCPLIRSPGHPSDNYLSKGNLTTLTGSRPSRMSVNPNPTHPRRLLSTPWVEVFALMLKTGTSTRWLLANPK